LTGTLAAEIAYDTNGPGFCRKNSLSQEGRIIHQKGREQCTFEMILHTASEKAVISSEEGIVMQTNRRSCVQIQAVGVFSLRQFAGKKK